MTHYPKITANSYIISLGNTGARLSHPLVLLYKCSLMNWVRVKDTIVYSAKWLSDTTLLSL